MTCTAQTDTACQAHSMHYNIDRQLFIDSPQKKTPQTAQSQLQTPTKSPQKRAPQKPQSQLQTPTKSHMGASPTSKQQLKEQEGDAGQVIRCIQDTQVQTGNHFAASEALNALTNAVIKPKDTLTKVVIMKAESLLFCIY